MLDKKLSRRDCLGLLSSGAALTTLGTQIAAAEKADDKAATPVPTPSVTPDLSSTSTPEDRARRMLWWHRAKFGMFVHWGLYSVLGRHEWVMEQEGIPIEEYEPLAKKFKPRPHAAREWAKLARRAGQKYMVMTTKHHDGFCLFDTKFTNYSAPKQACGRDLVQEFVDAARAEGMRVGFYYSIMDWHHPDGVRCKTDPEARKRYLDYIHGQALELMSNYGKIDIFWFDVNWPLSVEELRARDLNLQIRRLQPGIIINDRSGLSEDLSTPEHQINPAAGDRAWETCITMNESWGYHAADDNWKSTKTEVRNLVTCAHDGGNYLLNIGPKPDGSVPEESVKILGEVGDWMKRNGHTIYESEKCRVMWSNYAGFTRKGNKLYIHVHFWPGEVVSIGGMTTKVKSARLLATGKEVEVKQDDLRVRFMGLPKKAPDYPVTVIEAECGGEPVQDPILVRTQRKRYDVNARFV